MGDPWSEQLSINYDEYPSWDTYFASMDKISISVPKQENDLVNSPSHYTSHPSGIECIEVTEHYNFCVGNAIKYLWRNGLKSEYGLKDTDKQIQDLEKAIWYINREISNLKNGTYE